MAEIDALLQTVMFTIYGNQYESREEHLLLTMFQVTSIPALRMHLINVISSLFLLTSLTTLPTTAPCCAPTPPSLE